MPTVADTITLDDWCFELVGNQLEILLRLVESCNNPKYGTSISIIQAGGVQCAQPRWYAGTMVRGPTYSQHGNTTLAACAQLTCLLCKLPFGQRKIQTSLLSKVLLTSDSNKPEFIKLYNIQFTHESFWTSPSKLLLLTCT